MERQLGTSPSRTTDAIPKSYVDTKTQYGTYASRPAAGNAGTVYYCSDTDAVYRDNGTSWDKIRAGAFVGTGLKDPATTGYTSAPSMGTATFATNKDSRLLTVPASNNLYAYEYWPLSVTSNYTATFYLDPPTVASLATSGMHFGIILLNSSAPATFVTWGFDNAGTASLAATAWSSQTAISTTYSTTPVTNLPSLVPSWLRFRDDGTTRYYELSSNGLDWLTFFSHARTTFVTPNQVGWGCYNNTTLPMYWRMRSSA